MKLSTFCFSILASSAVFFSSAAFAELKLPSIFTDNLVLQRDLENVPVWGWSNPGDDVTVEFAGQSVTGKAGEDGRWEVKLAALKTNAIGQELKISVGEESITLINVLVGEVWLCSGQSNMQWPLNQAYDADLELLATNFPNIRLISVPQVGTQELQDDFKGKWEKATPETVASFSAVGWYFGKQIFQTLKDVPIGLIDNSWGGSAAEAWVRRDVLEADPDFASYIKKWAAIEESYNHGEAVEKWKTAVAKAKTKGTRTPRVPNNPLAGQHRPGNLYAGVLNPIIGYGIRGSIWYQGESNAGRAWKYRKLFPKMISHWREEWGQGDFSFYWVSLADFKAEAGKPADALLEADWAVLRESQTATLALPNTGEAIIYDIGEGRDIHPRNKEDVGKRLARWALANDYGFEIPFQSPTYKSHEIGENKIIVTFDHVGSMLYSFDTREPIGFEIAGEDQVFHPAVAKLADTDKVEVSNIKVPNPVAVRYAWSDNPKANLRSRENLPATPFRTDEWKVVTQP